jgi:hypothetical protein
MGGQKILVTGPGELIKTFLPYTVQWIYKLGSWIKEMFAHSKLFILIGAILA